MKNEYWENEEFEDLVSAGLISMYETEQHKDNKKYPKCAIVTDKELAKIKSIGCYFYASDRQVWGDSYDISVDGIPKNASLSMKITNNEMMADWLRTEYCRTIFISKLNELPPMVISKNKGNRNITEIPYSLTILSATASERLHLQKTFVTLDQNGFVHGCFARSNQTGLLYPLCAKSSSYNEQVSSDEAWTYATLGAEGDKKYLWNVTAKEDKAKATFTVYPEEIKSLFYSRELPMTVTGRKRPMLHWVASHRRRMKEGIEIDIEKHLRGITEFEYNGTLFEITRPIKEKKA